MKKILLLTLLVLNSCGSDKLTKDKALLIINEQEERKPRIFYEKVYVGKSVFLTDSEQEKYKELENQGVLTITDSGKNRYEVMLTPEGDTFVLNPGLYGLKNEIVGIPSPYDKNPTIQRHVRTHTYGAVGVKELQTESGSNMANLSIVYKIMEETPFAILKGKTVDKSFTKMGIMTKTSDGWKLL